MQPLNQEAEVQKRVDKARKRRDEFIARVKREEIRANANPTQYRKRVALLAALGYSYIFGTLAILLVFLVGLIYVMFVTQSANILGGKLLIIIVFTIVAILRSMYIKFDKVGGLKLTRSEAPQLYAEVDSIADRLKAPRIDEIRINEELNAAAIQRPRLGIFGWYENTLLLGLPLLLSLEPDEARAVIAHEFGHFSGAHGKFSARIYRLNRTWEALRQNLARQKKAGWLFVFFFNWFQPRFSATTFALRRANEYQADEAAASLYGPHAIAGGLLRMPTVGSHLQKTFWGPYYDKVKVLPHPPRQAFAALPAAAASATDPDLIEKLITRELTDTTNYNDTHPSFTDRFKALGLPPIDIPSEVARLSTPIKQSAAQVLLGDCLPYVLTWVEAEHTKEIGPQWADQYRKHQDATAALAALESKPNRSLDEEVERAYLTYNTRGNAEAQPILQAVLAQDPQNATALFWSGAILLEQEDASGIPLVEHAMQLNHRFSESGLRKIAAFHHARGDHEAVENLKDAAIQVMTESQVTQESAMNVVISDVFEQPHGVPPEIIEGMRRVLAARKDLGSAFLFRKVLPGKIRKTRLVLIAFLKSAHFQSSAAPNIALKAILKDMEFSEPTTVLVLPPSKPWLKRLTVIPNAQIHTRRP